MPGPPKQVDFGPLGQGSPALFANLFFSCTNFVRLCTRPSRLYFLPYFSVSRSIHRQTSLLVSWAQPPFNTPLNISPTKLRHTYLPIYDSASLYLPPVQRRLFWSRGIVNYFRGRSENYFKVQFRGSRQEKAKRLPAFVSVTAMVP